MAQENKKKIAFVIPSLNSGGAERVVTNLSNELSEKYDIVVITFIKVVPFYKLGTNITLEYCTEHVSPSKNILQSISSNYMLIRGIYKILKKHKIELSIAFLTSANNLTIIASFLRGIPCIVSERINPLLAHTSTWRRRLRRFLYSKANYVVVQTPDIQKYFSAWLPSSKLRILPNPLSPDLVAPEGNGMQRENIILNVGRLTDQKAQGFLIKAFAAINPSGWTLAIAGDGPNHDAYVDLVENLGMSEKIKLLGQQKNISDYYSRASIFAFTSRFEGFPNALIEAMHMGLACVSTDCPSGPSELINSGENGFLIPVDNQQELEEKLLILINDASLREEFSKLGKNTVAHFNITHVAQDWEDLIISAIK